MIFFFFCEDTLRVSSHISNAEMSLWYVHHFLEQIGQVIRVISTESVVCSAVVMAAGAQNALHFHYDQSNAAHSKVHSWCTPFILNEEVAAAVQ